ncbi:MAG: hypothetical protein IPL39_18115 [Opitutaceae bacterium]|nr:hypothetical protein [Opitutaceae bacterium]
MNEIAVTQPVRTGWRECMEQVPGFGYPAVVHASKAAAWIEVGKIVGRVSAGIRCAQGPRHRFLPLAGSVDTR